MKPFYVLLMLLTSFTNSYAKTVDGYIITLKGDTVFSKIKIPGAFSNFNYNEVEIIDSTNESKVLTPEDIKGYGYHYKNKDYVFMSKKIKKGTLYFLEQIVGGTKASLYQYISSNFGYGSDKVFYTFEKAGGINLFIVNYAALSDFRNELRFFYSENIEVQKLIDSKFNGRGHIQDDIKEIVEAVNK